MLAADVTGASTALSGAFEKISDDPSAAEKALKSFNTKLAASAAKVTNPTVKAAADKASKSLSGLDTHLKKYAADQTDTDAVNALQSASSKVQSAFTNLGSVCD